MKLRYGVLALSSLTFCLGLLVGASLIWFKKDAGDQSWKDRPTSDVVVWKDLPASDGVVHCLLLNKGFLGPRDEGWDDPQRLARWSGMECSFLPEAVMVHEEPVLKVRSAAALGRWFAKAYYAEHVLQRGTSVKEGASARIYARGPESARRCEVKVQSFRKLGHFLELQVLQTGPGALSPRDEPWWPLLDLRLGSLPAGDYTLEMVWLDDQGLFSSDADHPSPTRIRYLTKFSVVAKEPDNENG
jgi:hypothetical protein